MYDIIIIGAGPGGYIAAERAGEKGKSVLLIEKNALGGVCLNEGCIPTKTLLNSAKHYVHAKEAEQFGVSVTGLSFDLAKAMKWKVRVRDTLRKGIAFMMKKYNVEVVSGSATMLSATTVEVDGTHYEGSHIIIGTGSAPFVPPIPGAQQDNVLTSTGILEIEKMPKSLVVIGGGVIGVEFASFFGSLGVEVTIVEMLDEIIPFMDGDQAKELRKAFKKSKTATFHLNAKVERIEGEKVFFTKDGKEQSLDAEIVLMAVGRRSNVTGMGFETIGLDMNQQGIVVDEQMRTNLPNVFAIGDVTGTSLLAHSASRMGEVAVNTILGKKDSMRYNAIPWALYSLPEAAGCGLTEAQAQEKGIEVKTAMLPMKVNGRFLAENANAPGSCKVVVDATTHAILGVHLLGGLCSEMIWGAATLIETELRVDEVTEIIFPHPSVSEIIKDTLFTIH